METDQKRYLDEATAAQVLGVSRSTLQRWRRTGGDVPSYVRIGQLRIAYDRAVIDAWLAKRTFSSRAAELASVTGKVVN